MTAFFEAFWPNLAATVIGIALGVPIALYLNRQFTAHQRRLEEAEIRRHLHSAIDVLIDACEYNIKVLDSIRELSLSGQVMRSPDLRLTTWDAVGDVLSHGCSPQLMQLLSHHWLRLYRLERLSTEIFAREVARSLPAIDDPELTRSFWQELHDSALNLSAHASLAVKMLSELKTQDGILGSDA